MPSIFPSFVTLTVTGVQASQLMKALHQRRETMPPGPTRQLLDELHAMIGDDTRHAFLREAAAMEAESRGSRAMEAIAADHELRSDLISRLEQRQGRAA